MIEASLAGAAFAGLLALWVILPSRLTRRRRARDRGAPGRERPGG